LAVLSIAWLSRVVPGMTLNSLILESLRYFLTMGKHEATGLHCRISSHESLSGAAHVPY